MNPIRTTLLLALCFGNAAAAETSIHSPLQDALLCQGDALQAVYDLQEAGSNFAAGYAVDSVGEEIDTRVIVILEKPLTVAGASTRSVIGGPGGPIAEEDFAGLVYAKFTGDYQRVVKELGLAAPAKDAAHIGQFQKAVPSTVEGEENSGCPPTIGLTPLPEEGQFLLGCGWCNGG